MKIFIYDENRVLMRTVGTPDIMQGENNATLIFMSVAGIDETNFQNYLAQFAATIGTSHPADIITDFGTYVLDGVEYKGWKYFVSSKFTQVAGALNANLILSSGGSTLISQTVTLNVNPSASGVTWFQNITQAQWNALVGYCIGMRNPNMGTIAQSYLDYYYGETKAGSYVYFDNGGKAHLLFVGYDSDNGITTQNDYSYTLDSLKVDVRERVNNVWSSWTTIGIGNVPSSRLIAGLSLEANISENALFDKMSIKGRYATLSDLQTASPDNGYCYLVETDNHWYYWNGTAWTDGGVYLASLYDSELDENSTNAVKNKVIAKNLNNVEKSINLFDISKVVVGGYFSSTGGIATSATSEYNKEYIKVEPGNKYILGNQSGLNLLIATYDSNKNFIERVSLNDQSKTTYIYTPNNNVACIRVSIYDNSFNSYFFVMEATDYVENRVYDLLIDGSKINPNSINNSSFEEESISKEIADPIQLETLTFSNYEKYVDVGDGYINDVGTFTSNANYHTKKIVAINDFTIWFESSASDYISIVNYESTLQNKGTFIARYRNGDNNLPTSANPLTVNKGQSIAITLTKDTDANFGVYNLFNKFVLKEKYLLQDAQIAQVIEKISNSKIVAKKNSATSYTITMNGYTIPWTRRVRQDVRADQWNIAGDDIKKNGVTVCPDGTDILGVLQEVGESDFMGGVHGDETVVSMKMFADGKSIENETFDTLYCNSLDIVMQSHLTRVSTGENVVDRFVHLNFHGDAITVETTFKCLVNNFALSFAYNGGMFACYKEQCNFLFLNNGFYDLTNPQSTSEVASLYSITAGLSDDIEFTAENIIGYGNANYRGKIVYYSSELIPRLKVYYSTDSSTTWNAGHICNGKCKYILR